jgi:hypothetical protein
MMVIGGTVLFADGVDQLGAVLDDALLSYFLPTMKPVMFCRNRSGMLRWLQSWMNCAPFCDDSENRMPLLARMPTGKPWTWAQPHTRVEPNSGLNSLQARAVDDPRDHLAGVVRHLGVGRHDPEQLVGVVARRLDRPRRRRRRLLPVEVGDDLAAQAQGVELVGGQVVRDARDRACISAPPSSSWLDSSPVAIFTSGGPAR